MAMPLHERRRNRQLRLILAPSALLLLVLFIWPALYAVYLSFTNEALIGAGAAHPRFVGMKNYQRLFGDPAFWNSLWVTLLFVAGSAVIGQFVLGLVSALILRRKVRFRQMFNAIILLPNAVPEVVVGFMWIAMFVGEHRAVLNKILAPLGIEPVEWLQTLPLMAIIIVNTWRGIATAMILLTAGLSSISTEVYEAARLDGATRWQIFRRITMPLLMPTVFLYMLVSTASTMAIFGVVYALTRGGPGGATELISIYIYNQSFTAFQIGYGAAGAVMALLLSIVIGIVYVRTMKVEV